MTMLVDKAVMIGTFLFKIRIIELNNHPYH